MWERDNEHRAVGVTGAWADTIPAAQWEIYWRVLALAQEQELRFALGGAFALAAYTAQWRNTKDIDIYVLPQDRQQMIDCLNGVGLDDYYDQNPYDRSWIYRAFSAETLVDVIWAMANQRAQVDDAWLTRGPLLAIHGVQVAILPPEELLWSKLYIMQRDRCDWPDIFNLLFATGPNLDWEHVLSRVGEDVLLLRAVLNVFTWLCPGKVQEFPTWLWGRLHLPAPHQGLVPNLKQYRIDLLDTRPWFHLPPSA